MKILEQEIALRDETRSTEQARAALAPDVFAEKSLPLATTQDELKERTAETVVKVKELVDGERKFAREIALLTRVGDVMEEARAILASPETGPTAIAAETEAIELLLQAKRINPKSGGGGGATPGGGGSGTTQEAALALLGDGSDENAAIEDREVGQATGVSGRRLPEEFRSGLDAFFNSLQQRNR